VAYGSGRTESSFCAGPEWSSSLGSGTLLEMNGAAAIVFERQKSLVRVVTFSAIQLAGLGLCLRSSLRHGQVIVLVAYYYSTLV